MTARGRCPETLFTLSTLELRARAVLRARAREKGEEEEVVVLKYNNNF
jgi:hypothetical protein